MKNLLLILLSVVTLNIQGQVAPNFTVTDVDGNAHNLYTDYLDQGKIVALKIFFVNCPPCNAAAPSFQTRYEQWGAGSQDVQFFSLTNKVSDANSQVNGFKNQHGLTMPVVSAQGGAVSAQAKYTDGTFGPFFGTPHYIIIAPDKTVYYDVSSSQINQTIMDIQGSMGAPSTPVELSTNLGSSLPDGVALFIKPLNANGPIINITAKTNGTHAFDYPSNDFPEMVDPIIFLQSAADAQNGQLRAGDLIPIRKHILGLTPFTDERDLIAADVTGDGKIRTGDLVDLRKIILGLENDFPNQVPSYMLYPSEVPFSASGTNLVTIDLEILKIGNLVD